MKKYKFLLLPLAVLLVLGGCDEPQQQAEKPAPVSNDAQPETPEETRSIIQDRLEEWMGQWNGPEGTYLILEKNGEGYAVRIKDLDSEQRYIGVAQNQTMGINFTRNGQQESLTFVPGYRTGMKWLQDKPYCLMVKQGEAYCRDKL